MNTYLLSFMYLKTAAKNIRLLWSERPIQRGLMVTPITQEMGLAQVNCCQKKNTPL